MNAAPLFGGESNNGSPVTRYSPMHSFPIRYLTISIVLLPGMGCTVNKAVTSSPKVPEAVLSTKAQRKKIKLYYSENIPLKEKSIINYACSKQWGSLFLFLTF